MAMRNVVAMRMNPAAYARTLQDKVPISQIVGHYTELKSTGGNSNNYQCVCPFHDDTNPSMGVSDDKGLYHCFSCGVGGNVIKFVKEIDELSFTDAIKKVAELADVKLDAEFDAAVAKVHTPLSYSYVDKYIRVIR
jgi:DNA primase